MPDTIPPRGRFFEDLPPGTTVVTPGRTVTETDLVNFAGLSGDYNQIHINAEYARQGPFGQRVVYGLLGLSMATGLLAQLGFIAETALAFRDLTWKFSLPIFIGDTIHVKATVREARLIPRLKAGMVTLAVEIINQNGDTVQSGAWNVLIAVKPQ